MGVMVWQRTREGYVPITLEQGCCRKDWNSMNSISCSITDDAQSAFEVEPLSRKNSTTQQPWKVLRAGDLRTLTLRRKRLSDGAGLRGFSVWNNNDIIQNNESRCRPETLSQIGGRGVMSRSGENGIPLGHGWYMDSQRTCKEFGIETVVDGFGVELRLEVAQPICMAFVSSIQQTSTRREISATL